MSRLIVLLMIGFCCAGLTTAQTFQYSRGWTNGKRSGSTAGESVPSLRQLPNPLLMTANELNNRERLLQHIIKNPCDVRAALMSTRGFKFPNEDYPSASAELVDDDVVSRLKRELDIHH